MAESVCRALRDGSLEGEYATGLTIKDSISSPFGFDVFTHILTQHSSHILAGKSQSRGIVLVAFSRSPLFYIDLLKSRGIDVASSQKWIWILDCYTDPLGWKNLILGSENKTNLSHEASNFVSVCNDVKDVANLFSLIIDQGKGLAGQEKGRFSVAIDSVTEMLRHVSTSAVAGLIGNLRGFDKVSSSFWLLHEDLHEIKTIAILEYMSSMVASLESIKPLTNGQRGELDNPPLLEQNSRKGKFNVRFKRRNGRVRVMCEEFYVEQSAIKFTSVSSDDAIVNQGLLPKLQFNLQLSEKERVDRAKVVLPFEHQGMGKPLQIYDGRRPLTEGKDETVPAASTVNLQTEDDSGKGEIIYFRDSDDERPDSDEDPDDDLDI